VTAEETYELFALRYAERTGLRGQHFLGHDATADQPHPTAYYVWLARSARHTVLVDAGMTAEVAAHLDGMSYRASPVEMLRDLGVAPGDVDLTILTHLHYDHTGVVGELPATRFVVQQSEWDYWHGPWAKRIEREAWLRPDRDLDALLTASTEDRVTFVDGDREVLPGLSAHHVGGHTAGMQVVRVRTASGPVVVASDASHFYENLEDDRPAPLLHEMPAVYAAFDRIRELAGPDGLFLPGHDPELMSRHPQRIDGAPDVAVVG
jgi:glyoxylase-like metal-dependent hydrolase (beta-lactamase superfamily II)